MQKWIAIRSDTKEEVRKKIQIDYQGRLIKRGKGTELWEVDVDYEENLSLSFILGPPLEAKFKIGTSAYVLGQEVTINSFDFVEVNGAWEIQYEVQDSQGKASKFYQNQLADKP